MKQIRKFRYTEKEEVTMVNQRPRCSKCGGNVIRDDAEYKCLSCGQEWKSLTEKARFYDDNRSEIVKDVKQLGSAAARKKWQIPSGSFSQLLHRWNIPLVPAPVVPDPADPYNRVVSFPVFNSSWPESVMLKWLEVYEHIEILNREVKSSNEQNDKT